MFVRIPFKVDMYVAIGCMKGELHQSTEPIEAFNWIINYYNSRISCCCFYHCCRLCSGWNETNKYYFIGKFIGNSVFLTVSHIIILNLEQMYPIPSTIHETHLPGTKDRIHRILQRLERGRNTFHISIRQHLDIQKSIHVGKIWLIQVTRYAILRLKCTLPIIQAVYEYVFQRFFNGL